MEDKVRIISLGGQDEIDKNLIVVEVNDEIYVCDCGIKYPDKTKLGIDFIIPRFDYLVENKKRIKGYFISKGHDVVLGGLPYIIKRAPAPVFCTDITKLFLCSFCEHNHIKVEFDFRIVKPSEEVMIGQRKIRFFQTCCNMSKSFGVAISTSKGNIVLINDFVIDNNGDVGFMSTSQVMASVAEEDNLLLMLGSYYAERSGYTNPKYKLVNLIEQSYKEASGRVFVAVENPDFYNIEQIIKLAIRTGRKVIAFDDSTKDLFQSVMAIYKINFPRDFYARLDDINRLPPQEVMVILSGFGSRVFHKIALFATGEYDDKRLKLNASDTFIIGLPNNSNNEVIFSDTINELYKTDCHIVYFKKDMFLKMHPSQEDLKTMISLFRPKYYMPISGTYRQLLANARMAVDMGFGLNHTNVFIVDNGMVVEFNEKGGHITQEKIITGDLLVDGRGVGEIDNKLVQERATLAQDGVIILGVTVSLKQKKIIAGPDIQTRGLVLVKESETLMKEINRIFISIVQSELAKNKPSILAIEEASKDTIFKQIRRMTLKSPMIVPIIEKIDD